MNKDNFNNLVAQSDVPLSATDLTESVTGLDLSLYEMLTNADWVVRITMFLLLLASIVSWAIIINKIFAMARYKRQAGIFEKQFNSGRPLNEVASDLIESNKKTNPFETMFLKMVQEWQRDKITGKHFISRLEWIMDSHTQNFLGLLNFGLSSLAAIASVSPFVGLFGTVWGIMNSFRSIAASGEAHLSIVAPGIAEALLATAAGLVAAIPAVVAYNLFSAKGNALSERMSGQGETFLTILARHLDQTETSEVAKT